MRQHNKRFTCKADSMLGVQELTEHLKHTQYLLLRSDSRIGTDSRHCTRLAHRIGVGVGVGVGELTCHFCSVSRGVSDQRGLQDRSGTGH